MDPAWSRSCADCAKWVYTDDGEVMKRPPKIGLPVLRPAGTPTPCSRCPKIPASAPAKTREYAIELTDQNFQAWQHYLECRAIGRFPDDPIVRRNARILREVYDEYEKLPLTRLFHLLAMRGPEDGR